jgi:hypothetical protein
MAAIMPAAPAPMMMTSKCKLISLLAEGPSAYCPLDADKATPFS